MKKYRLETSRNVYAELYFELPDDVDLEEFVALNGIEKIEEIEGYNEIRRDYDADEYPDDWYCITDEDDNIISEY